MFVSKINKITMNKILFICGSLNQTTMMHKISMHLSGHKHFFTPYYGDNIVNFLAENSYLDFTILGGKFKQDTLKYLTANNLNIDYKGLNNDYDLIITCSDLIVPRNILHKKIILVQEGMTDPENFLFYAVKYLKFPRFIASTSTTGLSDCYEKFCVASEGYKSIFYK